MPIFSSFILKLCKHVQQKISREKALQKIRHFCAYQERSHKEVKDKLYGFGLRYTEVEETLTSLIEDNYLNEERFALQFAGGRFRLKHWGKIKIAYELKQKQVSDYNIRHALAGIDDLDYKKTLQKLAEAKWNSIKEEHPITKQSKTYAYLLQRGFEKNLISETLQKLTRK